MSMVMVAEKRWCGGLAAVLALLAGQASAQVEGIDAQADKQPEAAPIVPVAPATVDLQELRRLVADLASEDAEKRIIATGRLVERPDIRLRDLETMLESPELLAEQRQRLLGVAQSRFYGEPRGGLGFETDGQLGGRGVGIRNVVAGFPAANILQAEDRIISINGIALADFASIRPIIVSHDPGDVLALTIVRKGETLNVKVPLGSFNQLRNSMLDQGVMAAAWELRSRRLRGSPAAPILSGLAPTEWASENADASVMRVLEVGPRGRSAEDGEAGVVIGGEARGDMAASMGQVWRDGGIQLHQGMGRDLQIQQIEMLDRERLLRMARRDTIDVQLAMPNLPAVQRKELEDRRAQLQAEITALEMVAEQRRLDQLRRER
jgi:hypothetical protein